MARPKNPDSIPMTSGVYCIWEIHPGQDENYWEECLYIGAASNLRNRLNQHNLLFRYLKSRARNVRIAYKQCAATDLIKTESLMIKELKPTLNQAFPASKIEILI